jgi:hypothetical protein
MDNKPFFGLFFSEDFLGKKPFLDALALVTLKLNNILVVFPFEHSPVTVKGAAHMATDTNFIKVLI